MNRMPKQWDVLVLGAGPAGCATAIALARLGYTVCVLGEWRRFDAIEGTSARTLQGLAQAGLVQAANTTSQAVPRVVHWNGEIRSSNQELLLDRRAMDAALRQDLAHARVPMLACSIRTWQTHANGHAVRIEADGVERILHASFVLEARGRLAPATAPGLQRGRKGPQTLSLLHTWQAAPTTTARVGIESMEQGWAWMACLADGRRYWQCTLDPRHTPLPPRAQITSWSRALRQSPLALQILGTAPAAAQIALTARPCTATLSAETGGPNWLRIGDAAMAVDPLSGNGIFQSLSSALQAPAVVHTLMQRPTDAALALEFHAQRIEHLYLRFARTGRDFYALEQRWPGHAFWRERSIWPDQTPLHAPAEQGLHIATRPVVDGPYIRQAETLVSTDQPLGMWRVAGVELAPLVRDLLAASQPASGAWLHERLHTIPPGARPAVLGWLQAHGLWRAEPMAAPL